MRKCVLLSLDLFFSVLILSVFIIITLNVHEQDNFDTNILHNYAKNVLLYMDESLSSQNSTLISANVKNYLPNFISYQISVDYYGSGNVLINSTILGDKLPNDYVSVKRQFSYGNNFGIANLKVWLGERGRLN